jgi:hypothetical protein
MSIKKRLARLEGGHISTDGQGLAALLAIPAEPLPTQAELETYVAHCQQEGRSVGLSGLLLEETL